MVSTLSTRLQSDGISSHSHIGIVDMDISDDDSHDEDAVIPGDSAAQAVEVTSVSPPQPASETAAPSTEQGSSPRRSRGFSDLAGTKLQSLRDRLGQSGGSRPQLHDGSRRSSREQLVQSSHSSQSGVAARGSPEKDDTTAAHSRTKAARVLSPHAKTVDLIKTQSARLLALICDGEAIHLAQLVGVYRQRYGKDLDYRGMGFSKLRDFVNSVKGLSLCFKGKTECVSWNGDANVAHDATSTDKDMARRSSPSRTERERSERSSSSRTERDRSRRSSPSRSDRDRHRDRRSSPQRAERDSDERSSTTRSERDGYSRSSHPTSTDARSSHDGAAANPSDPHRAR